MSCARLLAAIHTPKLTPLQAIVYATLVAWADRDIVRTTLQALATALNRPHDRKGILASLTAIAERGLIEITKENGVNHYRLLDETVWVPDPQRVGKIPTSDVGARPTGRKSGVGKIPTRDVGKIPTPNGGNQPIPEPEPRARVDSESSSKKDRESPTLDLGVRDILPFVSRSSRTRPAQIPLDWKPNDKERERATELGVDPDKATEEFVAYWRGCGKPRADWQATFRNRVITLAEMGRCKLAVRPVSHTEPRRPVFASGSL